MSNRPQTIQIFLPDGSPTSIKEAEITNRLVKAILFPRKKLEEVAKRSIVNNTGVYFLFGTLENETKPVVYIGEGENCYTRIQSHNRKKDFWTHCIIVTSKTNEYTKTDVKYLEHHSLKIAQEVGRYKAMNDTGSNRQSISEAKEHDLLDNFETAKILLATLGYPLFEEKRKEDTTKEILHCKGRDAYAEGEYTEDGMLVYKGGRCTLQVSPNAGAWVINKRQLLLRDHIIEEEDGMHVLQEDYIFDSVSGAASFVFGRNANGCVSCS